MHLVQLLLPIHDAKGQAYPRSLFDALATRLSDQFGGMTAYTRAPATGLWEADSGETVRDQVVVYEVMVDGLDRDWWARLRVELEARFGQREVVVRTHEIQRL
jgi:hypothetical protein